MAVPAISLIQTVVRFLFGAFFIVAGVTHFTNEAFFKSIVPPYLPWPAAIVYVSGVAEIALGILLMLPATTAVAAWGLIALLIAVFPANVHMALHPELYRAISRTALLVRLPIQGVLIAVAYWFTRSTSSG